jgi:hypothetical protein
VVAGWKKRSKNHGEEWIKEAVLWEKIGSDAKRIKNVQYFVDADLEI